ncbi:MAG TPA: hypothetical protein VGB42_05085 [Candidatus Thermoplasmatota archaeon]
MDVDEGLLDIGRSTAAAAAHDIRRFESAVWSLYTLSDNASLPAPTRAACRLAADHAVKALRPGDPRVTFLVGLVIEAGAGDPPPDMKVLLVRLAKAGVKATEADLADAPPPLKEPPPSAIVTDEERRKALSRVFTAIEAHLKDTDLTPVETAHFRGRLEGLRTSAGDVRTKTEMAWALLDSMERSLYFRTRQTGEGG